jgi:hypothetical protein
VDLLHCICRSLAQSRHPDRVGECPLSGVKRTFRNVWPKADIEPVDEKAAIKEEAHGTGTMPGTLPAR